MQTGEIADYFIIFMDMILGSCVKNIQFSIHCKAITMRSVGSKAAERVVSDCAL